MNPNEPPIISTKDAMRSHVLRLRREGRSVGVVPTMGALHAGHLSLVEASRRSCDATVVTIFVNPTQFGPGEDYQKYPRTLQRDLGLLADLAVDTVFAPSADEMYGIGYGTSIDVGQISRTLEGSHRPTHFQGVATVVLKLFQIIPADRAFFGRKDFQQCLVIKTLVRDLDVPIEVCICPTVREADGLAMSSRNVYLTPPQRREALALSQCLFHGEKMVASGERDAGKVLAAMKTVLDAHLSVRIDYLVIADGETLAPMEQVTPRAIALIAARVGDTRLIDNHPLMPLVFNPPTESGLRYLA